MVFAHWIKGICKRGKVYAVNEGGILPLSQHKKSRQQLFMCVMKPILIDINEIRFYNGCKSFILKEVEYV